MSHDAHLFIGGEWREGANSATHPIIDPATEETIGSVAHAEISDLDDALAAAERGFAAWRAVSAYERSRIMRKAANRLRADVPGLAARMTAEQGKPLAEARVEVAAAADIIDWAAEEGRRAYGWNIPSRNPEITQTVLREPVGPVAAFTPWNFPMNQPVRKIAAALASGCSVIIKGSEETPASVIAIATALEEAGLPGGVLNLVFGTPAEISRHLIASPVIRKVTFTGSTPVGRSLAALAGQHLKRITLELGGHAPVLVFGDADIADAAVRSAAAKFRNAGQVCTSPTRFVVQNPVFDDFVEKFAASAEKLQVGAGQDPATTMGPLSNERRLAAMQELVSDALDRGARLVTGGKRIGNRGYFFEPTVLAHVPLDARVMNEEPFGPIAVMNSFETMRDALEEANRLPYGLAAYAYATGAQTIQAVTRGVEGGMVSINHHGLAMPETPFGGVKDSGYGTEGGAEMLSAYFSNKFVTVRLPS